MIDTPALPLQQHKYFADALRRLGQPAALQKIPGAAPLVTLKRFGLRFASRGPVWSNATDPAARIDTLRNSPLRLINANVAAPDIYRAAGFRMMMTPASVAELDLSSTSEQRIAHAKPKWRNAWRRAEEAAFTVKTQTFDPGQHQWLLNADEAQQKAKGYRALPHAILVAYAQGNPNNAVVFLARQKRECIAAMLLLLHRPVATYHLGWSGPLGRQLNAHHRLVFAAADWLQNKRYRRFDLGVVDTDNAPGLARFKIGTGADVRSLGGTWLRLPGL